MAGLPSADFCRGSINADSGYERSDDESDQDSERTAARKWWIPFTLDKEDEAEDSELYVKVRSRLNKINRVSKSSLATTSSTSDETGGVVVETQIGRFHLIKSIFDRNSKGRQLLRNRRCTFLERLSAALINDTRMDREKEEGNQTNLEKLQ
ncbi:uncharacterized protein LOC107273018 [Cephus cinctus]|uniref:Uncharacterized protein LOC107273018 n=1 Tax=Cephus cinctus TaxID=211228 RepID=A0AAJ7FSM7_CEPCN|nr:uncharacterized protein LOC107273018 [Cephus cinctus]